MMPCPYLRCVLSLGALALGSACGPFVVLDDTGDGSSEAEESAEVTSATTTASTVSTSSTVSTASTTAATTASTTVSTSSTTATTTPVTTGNEPSYCGQTCRSLEDCSPPGSDPSDWACNDGFCEFVGPIPACEPQFCEDLMIGYCTEVDGVSVCATACNDDSACIPGFTECTGVDDVGNSICVAIPCNGVAEGEACFIEGFGQYGVCTDGLCTCTDDSQCAVDGWACNT
jgi:hypothetical protein